MSREADRQQLPASMRRDVRLLGDLLGEAIRDIGGQDLLDDVERLRHAVIAARDKPPGGEADLAGDQGGDPVPARARAASGVLRRRAGGDDGAPQLLHVVEQVLAAGVADHLAEQVGEQPDVASQGCG